MAGSVTWWSNLSTRAARSDWRSSIVFCEQIGDFFTDPMQVEQQLTSLSFQVTIARARPETVNICSRCCSEKKHFVSVFDRND
jgi:hypothetical protein